MKKSWSSVHCSIRSRVRAGSGHRRSTGGSYDLFTEQGLQRLSPNRIDNANPVRQPHSYCHGAVFDPAGERVIIPDLGADRLYVYDVDPARAQLRPASGGAWFESAPASGPRSFCFHPNGRWGYLLTEIDSTIVSLDYDSGDGSFTQIGETVCTIPDEWPGLDVDRCVLLRHHRQRMALPIEGC